MDRIILTDEKILGASDYIPMKEKEKFVSDVAFLCFDRLNISDGGNDQNGSIPPCYKENLPMKSRYLMSALARFYFHEEFDSESENNMSMPEELYEAWASGNPLNQIERLKKFTLDPDVRAKCFGILSDFRMLEKMLNSECYGLLNAMNDPVNRLMMVMDAQTSPEHLKQLMDSFSEVQRELEEFKSNSKFHKVSEDA